MAPFGALRSWVGFLRLVISDSLELCHEWSPQMQVNRFWTLALSFHFLDRGSHIMPFNGCHEPAGDGALLPLPEKAKLAVSAFLLRDDFFCVTVQTVSERGVFRFGSVPPDTPHHF